MDASQYLFTIPQSKNFTLAKVFTMYTWFLFPVSEAKAIFDANTVGPRAYVKMYDKYADILTGQSLNQKEEFLKSEATLDQFRVPSLVLFANQAWGWTNNYWTIKQTNIRSRWQGTQTYVTKSAT